MEEEEKGARQISKCYAQMTNYASRSIFLREGLPWKSHGLVKEVRGIVIRQHDSDGRAEAMWSRPNF